MSILVLPAAIPLWDYSPQFGRHPVSIPDLAIPPSGRLYDPFGRHSCVCRRLLSFPFSVFADPLPAKEEGESAGVLVAGLWFVFS
jgi:hypothetical protein